MGIEISIAHVIGTFIGTTAVNVVAEKVCHVRAHGGSRPVVVTQRVLERRRVLVTAEKEHKLSPKHTTLTLHMIQNYKVVGRTIQRLNLDMGQFAHGPNNAQYRSRHVHALDALNLEGRLKEDVMKNLVMKTAGHVRPILIAAALESKADQKAQCDALAAECEALSRLARQRSEPIMFECTPQYQSSRFLERYTDPATGIITLEKIQRHLYNLHEAGLVGASVIPQFSGYYAETKSVPAAVMNLYGSGALSNMTPCLIKDDCSMTDWVPIVLAMEKYVLVDAPLNLLHLRTELTANAYLLPRVLGAISRNICTHARVWRGSNLQSDTIKALEVGQIYCVPNALSADVKREVASKFARQKFCELIEIIIPRGSTRAASIAFDSCYRRTENEVLILPWTAFRVVKNKPHLVLEILSDEERQKVLEGSPPILLATLGDPRTLA